MFWQINVNANLDMYKMVLMDVNQDAQLAKPITELLAIAQMDMQDMENASNAQLVHFQMHSRLNAFALILIKYTNLTKTSV